MTRTALPHLAPAHDPKAAVEADAPGDVTATGDVTGLHHHHLAAGPPLAPGPALTLVATGLPPAVAVTTIADMAVDANPHHGATGPTLAPTAPHLHQTGTTITDATGPAPGLPVV